MKEQIGPIQSELTPIKSELTGNFNNPKLNVEGNIFMSEPGNGETQQTPREPNNVKVEAPAKKLDPDEEWTKRELEKMGVHPIAGASDTDPNVGKVPEIKTGRATWHTQGGDKEINVRSYMGKDPYDRDVVIIEDNEGFTWRVPIDEIEYPQEAQAAGGSGGGEPPEGPPTETVTPQEPEDENGGEENNRLKVGDYTVARLKNIVRELNAEANRVGEGNPLSARYLERQIDRVRKMLDSDPTIAVEANKLLKELNTWMAEAEESGGRYFTAKDEIGILANKDNERERIFEEIFVGVDANPGVAFNGGALSLEASGKLDYFFTLLSHARIYDDSGLDITENQNRSAEVSRVRDQLFSEYSGKREIRRILHDANWSVSGGGDIQAFAGAMATFKSSYIDLIFEDPLVSTALHMFEQSFQQIRADNNGQLPPEQLEYNYKRKSSMLEDKVWDLMREQIPPGTPEWKIRRAIIFARGFGVASLRFPEIAAEARLPEETPMASTTERMSRFGSIYGEAIARYLDPFEHLIEKFAIGEEDRALLYYFLTGDKKKFESNQQLHLALKMASDQSPTERRLIDIVNIWRIGGGFSQTSWRQFMSMKDLPPEERRRFGVGVLESRVHGDVDDEIRDEIRKDPKFKGRLEEEDIARAEKMTSEIRVEVRRDPKFAGKSAEDIEAEVRRLKDGYIAREGKMAQEVKKRAQEKIVVDGKEMTVKEEKVLQRRLKMWKDAIKVNPLRVMWQWEEKEPSKRIELLCEALDISIDDAKTKLPQIEKDLILIQEDAVQRLGRGAITYGDDDQEMLEYSLIGGANPTPEDFTRRSNVQQYVAKIREKAEENNYAFIKSLFDKTPAERSPFPFVIGFEDIPFSDFDFINTGGRGFARRINDFAASVTATNELLGLITNIPKTHDVGPLIESLDKMKQAVSLYDKSIAMEVVPYFARGIIRMYDKDLIARLPLGMGTLAGLLSDTSFAQTLYGREAMTWDEGDKHNFTRHLLLNHLASKDEVKKLRKEVGATTLNLGVDIARTYGQLALLLLLYNFARQATSESK